MAEDDNVVYEMTLTPAPGQSWSATKKEFEALVKQAFEEENQGHLLTDGSVKMSFEKPFTGGELVVIVLIWVGKEVVVAAVGDILKDKVRNIVENKFQGWFGKKSASEPETPSSGT